MLSAIQDTFIHTSVCNLIISHGSRTVARDTEMNKTTFPFFKFPTTGWTSILFLMEAWLDYELLRKKRKETNISQILEENKFRFIKQYLNQGLNLIHGHVTMRLTLKEFKEQGILFI